MFRRYSDPNSMSDSLVKRPKVGEGGLFGDQDYSGLQLKPDHSKKPLWICPNGHIFLETTSAIYSQITDFLIAISEPVSRPQYIHEYLITKYSLYSAASVKLEVDYIISTLQKHCKTVEVPESVIEFIRRYTTQYGKAKLLLQDNKYYIESQYSKVLDALEEIDSVRIAKVAKGLDVAMKLEPGGGDVDEELRRMMDADLPSDLSDLHRFEIKAEPDFIMKIKEDCHIRNYPLIEEYDFLNDSYNPRLAIDLKPTTHIRSYQEKSLSKMFSNGRARSGVIVLPCGAGKTLVGITGICTIKRRAMVLCTSGVAVDQWKDQLQLWTTIDPAQVVRFTSDTKDVLFEKDTAGVLISTYSMMGFTGKRAAESQEMFDKLKNREWGLLIMDEVQVVPADMFRKVIFQVNSHCKLGLTATLVREDERIEDLNFLIGPKLYEANWLDLQQQGFIAKVQCKEVWCPMTAEFFQEYLLARPARKIQLYVANPNKLMVCQYLVRMHENNGDKIIIFSDNLSVLELYGQYMSLPVITGRMSNPERKRIFQQFAQLPTCRTVLVSKVGDNSIDLPGANVIIQISSHFGSRRQEAQRLGRILRPKPNMIQGEFNAFFYSLVSQDTQEMWYANKRQQFLIDNGYAYEVMKATEEMFDGELRFKTKEEQKALLERILQAREEGNEIPEDPDDITKAEMVNLAAISRSRGEIQRSKLFKERYNSK